MSDCQVIGFGEALLDIIYSDDSTLQASPGGSVLNTLVSLARSGHSTALITEIASDGPGRIITQFLDKEQVKLPYTISAAEGKTAVAFAVLDAERNASYTFYKSYPPERYAGYGIPNMAASTVFCFGSFYSIDSSLQQILHELKQRAISSKALLFFDPNIRARHFTSEQLQIIGQHFADANIIRASEEDFHQLFPNMSFDEIYARLAPEGNKLLVMTRAEKIVSAAYGALMLEMEIPPFKPLSTIGAGDAFNAGMIDFLLKHELISNWQTAMNKAFIINMISNAIAFATEVCLSPQNFIATKQQPMS